MSQRDPAEEVTTRATTSTTLGPNARVEGQVEAPPQPSTRTRPPAAETAPEAGPRDQVDVAVRPGEAVADIRADIREDQAPGPAVQATRVARGRRPHWLRIGLVAGAAVIVIGSVGVTYSPIFDAKHLRVRSGPELSRIDVLRLAEVTRSTNILHLDAGAIERRIEQSPWVESATVSRSFPSTLRIRVKERRPVASVAAAQTPRPELNGSLILTQDGSLIPSGVRGASLPTVVPSGGLPSLAAGDLRAGARVLAALPAELVRSIDHVSIAPERDVALSMRSGIDVEVGPPTSIAEKGDALVAILRWAASRNVRLATIDLRVPEAPAATQVNGSTLVPLRSSP